MGAAGVLLGDSGICYMTDSPAGANYLNNTNAWAGNTSAFSTAGFDNCHIQFLTNSWSVADDELTMAVLHGWRELSFPFWSRTGTSGGQFQWQDLDGTGFIDGLRPCTCAGGSSRTRR